MPTALTRQRALAAQPGRPAPDARPVAARGGRRRAAPRSDLPAARPVVVGAGPGRRADGVVPRGHREDGRAARTRYRPGVLRAFCWFNRHHRRSGRLARARAARGGVPRASGCGTHRGQIRGLSGWPAGPAALGRRRGVARPAALRRLPVGPARLQPGRHLADTARRPAARRSLPLRSPSWWRAGGGRGAQRAPCCARCGRRRPPSLRPSVPTPSSGPEVTVAVVQGNVPRLGLDSFAAAPPSWTTTRLPPRPGGAVAPDRSRSRTW